MDNSSFSVHPQCILYLRGECFLVNHDRGTEFTEIAQRFEFIPTVSKGWLS